jgi:hypothetical protein
MQRQGTRVFDRTQVKSITAGARSVQLTTATGMTIKAGRADRTPRASIDSAVLL